MLMHHFVGGLKLESVAEEIVSIFCWAWIGPPRIWFLLQSSIFLWNPAPSPQPQFYSPHFHLCSFLWRLLRDRTPLRPLLLPLPSQTTAQWEFHVWSRWCWIAIEVGDGKEVHPL
jgi:hypothetical protein